MADQQPRSSHPLYDVPKPPDGEGDPAQRARRLLVFEGAIQRPYVTYALLIINVAIFAVRYFAPELNLQILVTGVADADRILNGGEFYRLFTSMFLHLDETHILFNGLALYQIGSTIERVYGHQRYLLLYLLGGLAGSILATIIGGGGLGASGAVFGIFGALGLHFWQHRDIYGEEGRRQVRNAVFFIVLNFAIGFFANAAAGLADSNVRISNSGHFGGLAGGLILAWLIGPRLRIKQQQAGYWRTNDDSHQPIPVEQIILEDSNRLSWRWIGVYLLGLGLFLALGVLLT